MIKDFEKFRPTNPEQTLQSESGKEAGTETEVSVEEDTEIKQARDLFVKIFESHKDGTERIEAIIKRLDYFLKSDIFNGKQIEESLMACLPIEDKEKFVDGVISALEPIIAFGKENPRDFARMKRKSEMTREGMKEINEILYYGECDNYIHIHLASAEDLKGEELERLVMEGFQKLAEAVKNNEQIREIVAISWIVAHRSGKRIMERYGFELQGEIDEETRQQHFSEDERKISKATISREKFLEKYLK